MSRPAWIKALDSKGLAPGTISRSTRASAWSAWPTAWSNSSRLTSHSTGRGVHGERWLFEASAGHPPHQNAVGYFWRKACQQAGITGVTLPDLRHYYASGLIAAGRDVVTVQRALGHAKATATLGTRTCGRLQRTETRTAAESMLTTALAIPADSVRTGGRAQPSDLQ
jgi:integrase